MIKVESTVNIQEVDGRDLPVGQRTTMRVESHGNFDTSVILHFQEHSITVSAYDLRAAIDNATNSNRFGRS